MRAGKMNGSPLCGLCERVPISVRRILDGCRKVYNNVALEFTVSEFSPSSPIYPFGFLRLLSNGQTSVTSLAITDYDSEKSRVSMLTTTPLTVTFNDSSGNRFTAKTTLTLEREVLLKIPTSDYAIYSIEVATNLSSRVGRFVSPNLIRASCCIIQTIRVVTNAEILVPSYGDVTYPECTEVDNANQCAGISDDPTFFNA